MQFHRATLEDCHEATGVVVVIDVIRAFTTAAYALASGAEGIRLVGTVGEALALRERLPGAWVMGEVDGLQPPEFDLGNSPTAVEGLDLRGRPLIQRTSAGTQGVVRSMPRAEHLLACSLVCACATAEHIRRLAPRAVTFVITGVHADGGQNDGDEDAACADYLEALLSGAEPDVERIVDRVLRSQAVSKFWDPAHPEYPREDLDRCVAVDRFPRPLVVTHVDGQYYLAGGH